MVKSQPEINFKINTTKNIMRCVIYLLLTMVSRLFANFKIGLTIKFGPFTGKRFTKENYDIDKHVALDLLSFLHSYLTRGEPLKDCKLLK